MLHWFAWYKPVLDYHNAESYGKVRKLLFIIINNYDSIFVAFLYLILFLPSLLLQPSMQRSKK